MAAVVNTASSPRLTLVIKHTAHTTKKKKDGQPTPAPVRKEETTVIPYANAHDHFVLRAYRQLKAMVSHELMEKVDAMLDQIRKSKTEFDGLRMTNLNFLPSSISLDLIKELNPVEDKDQPEKKAQSPFEKLASFIKDQKSVAADAVGHTLDQLAGITENMSALVPLIQAELPDQQQQLHFFQLGLRVALAGTSRFSSSTPGAFLDDPTLSFYIFREGRRTIYVIKNTQKWTAMVQQDKPQFQWCQRRNRYQKVHQTKPTTQSEFEHLRSCLVRWMRGHMVHDLPEDWEETPKNVRRLIATTHLHSAPKAEIQPSAANWK